MAGEHGRLPDPRPWRGGAPPHSLGRADPPGRAGETTGRHVTPRGRLSRWPAGRDPVRPPGRLDGPRPGHHHTPAGRLRPTAPPSRPVPGHHPGGDRPPPPATAAGERAGNVVPPRPDRTRRARRRRAGRRPCGRLAAVGVRGPRSPRLLRHAQGSRRLQGHDLRGGGLRGRDDPAHGPPGCALRQARVRCHRGGWTPLRHPRGAPVRRGRHRDVGGDGRHRRHRARAGTGGTAGPLSRTGDRGGAGRALPAQPRSAAAVARRRADGRRPSARGRRHRARTASRARRAVPGRGRWDAARTRHPGHVGARDLRPRPRRPPSHLRPPPHLRPAGLAAAGRPAQPARFPGPAGFSGPAGHAQRAGPSAAAGRRPGGALRWTLRSGDPDRPARRPDRDPHGLPRRAAGRVRPSRPGRHLSGPSGRADRARGRRHRHVRLRLQLRQLRLVHRSRGRVRADGRNRAERGGHPAPGRTRRQPPCPARRAHRAGQPHRAVRAARPGPEAGPSGE